MAVFTAVRSFPSRFCCWWFMNNASHLGRSSLRFAAVVPVCGFVFPTIWRCYYDRNDDEQWRWYWLRSAVAGSILPAFWTCYYMNSDDGKRRFFPISGLTVISINWSLLQRFWCWYDLSEDNQQSGHQMRSTKLLHRHGGLFGGRRYLYTVTLLYQSLPGLVQWRFGIGA